MRTLQVSIIAAALVVGSAIAVVGQPDEGCVGGECALGEFYGRLAFDPMCDEVDDCDTYGVLEPFTDARLHGDVGITGWSQEIGEASVLYFGWWQIGDEQAGWVEVASPRLHHRDATPTQYTSVLVGTGANEGRTAVSEVTITGGVFDFHGHFLPRSMQASVTDFSGVIRAGDPAEVRW